MATSTYIPLATLTLAVANSAVYFTNISQDYSDLVLMIEHKGATGSVQGLVTLNGDGGTNYKYVYIYNTGSSSGSGAETASRHFNTESGSTTVANFTKMEIFDYSATDKHKSTLAHNGRAGAIQTIVSGRYASNTAISSITVGVNSGSFAIGSTFKLFGIHGGV
tara:strand:- start:717 stop:1208 length:492 start_codon:yes stop_codon:yes gene_type:complete